MLQAVDPERWLSLHGAVLYGYALARVRIREVAEDLVQETLTAALQAKERFRGASSERSWLVGILKNKVGDYFRRAFREAALPPEDMGSSPFDGEGYYVHELGPREWDRPDRQLERDELREHLQDCLGRLPERLRILFVMREMEGHRGPEICELFGLTATHLHTLLYRSRAALRRCLEGRVLDE